MNARIRQTFVFGCLLWVLSGVCGLSAQTSHLGEQTGADDFRERGALALISPFDPLVAILASSEVGEWEGSVEPPDVPLLNKEDEIARAICFGVLFANVESSIATRNLDLLHRVATAAETLFGWNPGFSTNRESVDWTVVYADFAFWSEAFLRDEDFRTVAALAAWLETLRHVTHSLKIRKLTGATNFLRAPLWVSSALRALDSLPVSWQSDGRIQVMKKALKEAEPLISCKIKEFLPQENLLTLQTLAEATLEQLCATDAEHSPAASATKIPYESPALPIARKLANKYRAKGYAIGPTGHQGLLAPGQSQRFQVPVAKGLDYVFLVATNQMDADFDISVKDDEGGLIRDDRRPDRFAGVHFRPSYSGTATVIVSLGSRESQGEWIFLAGRRPAPITIWP